MVVMFVALVVAVVVVDVVVVVSVVVAVVVVVVVVNGITDGTAVVRGRQKKERIRLFHGCTIIPFMFVSSVRRTR